MADELNTDKTYVARDQRRYGQGDLLVKIGWMLLLFDALLAVFVPISVRAEGIKSLMPWIVGLDALGAIALIAVGSSMKRRASDAEPQSPRSP